MIVVVSKKAIQQKYGNDASRVLDAVAKLKGTVLDVTDLTPTEIRALIDKADPQRGEPVCLIGGYDLVPTFKLGNPTFNIVKEVDKDVLTDGPYGARPGSPAEEFLPTRAVSRIPDSGSANADQFIAMLRRAAKAKGTTTPSGSFEQAALEFEGSARWVHGALTSTAPLRLSPPDSLGSPATQGLIAGRGRVHILLHGADTPSRWDKLYGAQTHASNLQTALKVADLATSDLSGSIVSFSSCYSAMLDRRDAAHPPRSIDNQPALACLVGGAKVVYGATRANWIDITAPFDSFGSALVAMIWQHLRQSLPAAEALRQARFKFAKTSLSRDPWSRPYVLKTVLQTQCYGHPQARL